MATIFTSSSFDDSKTALALESRLLGRGHMSHLPVGKPNAGQFRSNITRALSKSDALIAVLSANGLHAQNVLSEIGAARVLAHTKGMLLLPVLIESMEVPDFLSDFYCFRLFDRNFDRLAQELDAAIAENVNRSPRVFISHTHKDERIAAALVALLAQAFEVNRTDIRCTSVPEYSLAPGERTSQRLRSDIAGAEVVIGILSPGTAESDYVLCELGAAWGCDIATFPVLACGATAADIPPPLNELHSVPLKSEERCLHLVEYVANKTSLKRQEVKLDRIAKCARNLASAASIRKKSLGAPG